MGQLKYIAMDNTQTALPTVINDVFDRHSLNVIIQTAIRLNWERMALSDMGGESYKFSELAEKIERLHILFDAAGLKPGDKVAIIGKNSSAWVVAFVACLTARLTAVPILSEFKPESLHNLINHSDAKLMFVDHAIWDHLEPERLRNLVGAFYISERGLAFSRSKKLQETFDDLNEIFGKKYPRAFTADDVKYPVDDPDEIALINYTSGSTGMPKGVMLPYRSIWSNIVYCTEHLTFMKPGDGMVNMLPLGHLYGMVIETLHPLVKGCHCCFLTKTPSPKIILKAFADVRPKLIITVPLILEKIIKSKVFPQLRKPSMRLMLALPGVRNIILGKVRKALFNVFGGEVCEIIVGGAPLNPEVEKFLAEIKFPITVGYGMTECGPLITYAPPAETRPHTVGRIVDRMEARIDSQDPAKIPGNIMVRGDNVMKGYYKNPQATAEAFPYNDGWMNTGDMGIIADDGLISISGRSKTMILGPSGQNIYPEEIEHQLNNLPLVVESLVIQDNGKLVALVYPDFDTANKQKMSREKLQDELDANLRELNKKLESYNRLNQVRIMEEEFEKTPKRSIKRFLYQP